MQNPRLPAALDLRMRGHSHRLDEIHGPLPHLSSRPAASPLTNNLFHLAERGIVRTFCDEAARLPGMDVSCIDPLDLMVSPAQRGSSEFDTLQTMDFNSNYFDRNCYPNPPPPNPQLATFAGPYVNMQPGDIHLLGFGQENLDQSYPPMEFPYAYDQSNQSQGFPTNEVTAQSAQQTIGPEPCFMNMPPVLHEEYQASNGDIQTSVAQSVPTTAEGVAQYSVTSSLPTSNGFTPPPPRTITPKPVSSCSSKKRPLKMAADRSVGSRKRQLPCKPSRVPALAKGTSGEKMESEAAASQRNVSSNDRTREIKALRAHTVKIEEAMSLIKESVKPFSAFSQRKAAHLIRQGAELVKELSRLAIEEENFGNGSSDEDEISQGSSAISSRYSMSSSDLIDSESTTDNTSVSSTTHQAPIEDNEVVSVDDEETRDGHSPCVQCGNKPLYYCTRNNCNYSTHTPTEWRRHEESKKHSQRQGFMCLECPMSPPPVGLNGNAKCEYCDGPLPGNDPNVHYPQCAAAQRTGKTYGRKDRLITHLRDHHNITANASSIASNGKYTVDSKWPKQCGFCGKYFVTWDERMDHIATHFQHGKDMSSWKLPFPPPKDFRPRSESHKRNDGDSDDDMDDNSGGPGSRQPPNRRQKSSASISSSQQNNSSGNQTNRNQGNSRQRGQTSHHILNNDEPPVISNSQRHQKPSVALQRYLRDTDEIIPTLLNLEHRRSSATQNSAAKDDIVDPPPERFLSEPPRPLISSSPSNAGLLSSYKPLLAASSFSLPTTAKPEVQLAKQATAPSYFGPSRVRDVLERPESSQSIPGASLIEDPIRYAAYKIRSFGAIKENMEQEAIIEQIKKLDQGPQTIAYKKAALCHLQGQQLEELFSGLSSKEANTGFEWSLVQLEIIRGDFRPNATVYFKRSPVEEFAIRPPAPPATGFGRLLGDSSLSSQRSRLSPTENRTMRPSPSLLTRCGYFSGTSMREPRWGSEYDDHALGLLGLKLEAPNPPDTCHLCIRTTVSKFAFAAHLALQSILAKPEVPDQEFDAMTLSSYIDRLWNWTTWKTDNDLRELADTLKSIASLSSVEYDVSEPTISHFEELWRKKLDYRLTPRLRGNRSYFGMPMLSLDHLRDFNKEDLKVRLGQKVVEIKKKKEHERPGKSQISWRVSSRRRLLEGIFGSPFYSTVTADIDYGPPSRDSGSRLSVSPWENRYKSTTTREDERPDTVGRPVSYSQATRRGPPISSSAFFGDGDKICELESNRIGDRGKFRRLQLPPACDPNLNIEPNSILTSPPIHHEYTSSPQNSGFLASTNDAESPHLEYSRASHPSPAFKTRVQTTQHSELPPPLPSAPEYFAPSSLYAPPAKVRNRSLESPNLHGPFGQISYYSNPVLATSKNVIKNSCSSTPQSTAARRPIILTPNASPPRPPSSLTSAKTPVVYEHGSHYEQDPNDSYGYAMKGPDIPNHEIIPLHGLRTRRHRTVDSSLAKLQLWDGNNSSPIPIHNITIDISIGGSGTRFSSSLGGVSRLFPPMSFGAPRVVPEGDETVTKVCIERETSLGSKRYSAATLQPSLKTPRFESVAPDDIRSPSHAKLHSLPDLDGLFVPSETVISVNEYATVRSAKYFTAPDYLPTRWLDSESTDNLSIRVPSYYPILTDRFRPRNDEMSDNNLESLRRITLSKLEFIHNQISKLEFMHNQLSTS